MKITILIILLWLIAGCTSQEQRDAAAKRWAECMPTQQCWKAKERVYYRNKACEAARADAIKRYGTISGGWAKIYIDDPYGEGTLSCK